MCFEKDKLRKEVKEKDWERKFDKGEERKGRMGSKENEKEYWER
jgi:hypothetical protein